MDNPASGTRRRDDDTQLPPSPPNVMSKSPNISQSESHQATTGPTLQGRPSYPTMGTSRKALLDERLESAAGASSATASRRESPPTDNQTAHSAAASRGRQTTTEQFDVGLGARSRAGKVSTPYWCHTSARDPHQWPSVTASSRC